MTTSPGFDDLGLALRMRDMIQTMVTAQLNIVRPTGKYGRVQDVNRTALTAKVILNGDVEAITVKMSSLVQPLETDFNTGTGFGCMVLIEGSAGNYWIKDIISGHAYSSGQALADPRIFGGSAMQINQALHTVVDGGLPAVGNCYHMGRWDNSLSTTGDGTGYAWIMIRQELFSSLVKTYQIPLKTNNTAGLWRKVAPQEDHGTYSGNDCELEIKVDTGGFEIRVRRTSDGGGFTPGPYLAEVWAHMDTVNYQPALKGEVIDAAPTRFYNTDSVSENNGPFIAYSQNIANRFQQNLHGGGLLKMDTTANVFSWSERFLAHGMSLNSYLPTGYFEIVMPAVGTVIPRYGSAAGTTVTTVTAGIPLLSSETLYYEPPWGDTAVSTVATNFRIVAHSDTTKLFDVPSSWIMVATRTFSLSASGDCKVGNGTILNGPIWDTWTPSITSDSGGGNLGNSTRVARFSKQGRTVNFTCTISFGSTTSMGSGVSFIKPPLPPSGLYTGFTMMIGSGVALDVSAATRVPFFVISGSSNTQFSLMGTNGVLWGPTVPFTWATGDDIRLQGTYECDGP